MSHFKKLVGDRIYLSPKTTDEEDIVKYTEWMNDFQVTDYTGATAKLITLDSEREWMNNIVKNTEDYNFDIVDLNNDKLIGTISLVKIKTIERSAELGIFIGEDSYRIRVGDYRIIYNIFDDIVTVEVININHRREVYKRK